MRDKIAKLMELFDKVQPSLRTSIPLAYGAPTIAWLPCHPKHAVRNEWGFPQIT